jgi:hypothetical protein
MLFIINHKIFKEPESGNNAADNTVASALGFPDSIIKKRDPSHNPIGLCDCANCYPDGVPRRNIVRMTFWEYEQMINEDKKLLKIQILQSKLNEANQQIEILEDTINDMKEDFHLIKDINFSKNQKQLIQKKQDLTEQVKRLRKNISILNDEINCTKDGEKIIEKELVEVVPKHTYHILKSYYEKIINLFKDSSDEKQDKPEIVQDGDIGIGLYKHPETNEVFSLLLKYDEVHDKFNIYNSNKSRFLDFPVNINDVFYYSTLPSDIIKSININEDQL